MLDTMFMQNSNYQNSSYRPQRLMTNWINKPTSPRKNYGSQKLKIGVYYSKTQRTVLI